jgi:hypothetical protein
MCVEDIEPFVFNVLKAVFIYRRSLNIYIANRVCLIRLQPEIYIVLPCPLLLRLRNNTVGYLDGNFHDISPSLTENG